MVNKIFCSWVMFAMLSFGVFTAGAQTSQEARDKKTSEVRAKIRKLGLGQGVKVKVKLYNDTTYQGYVKEANDESFAVVDKAGNPISIKYADVSSVGGRNFSTGAKIGIGVAIGVVAAILTILGIIAAAND